MVFRHLAVKFVLFCASSTGKVHVGEWVALLHASGPISEATLCPLNALLFA